MNFFIMWLCTILLSLGITMSNAMRLIKDIADLGYKIDMEEIEKIDSISFNSSNNILLSLLVPFYNIMIAMQMTMQYNSDRSNPIDALNVMGLLEQMDTKELEEYSKNPTLLKALSISAISNREQNNSDIDLTNSSYIKFHDDGSEVYFNKNDKSYDIIILKVTGPLSKLSKSEQLKKVRETWRQMQESIVENNELPNTDERLNSIDEQIQSLKDLKGELLNKDNNSSKQIKKIKK